MGDSCRDQGAAAQVNVTGILTALLHHLTPSHSKTTVYRRWFHVYSPEFGRVYKRMTMDNLRPTIYSIDGSQLTIGSALLAEINISVFQTRCHCFARCVCLCGCKPFLVCHCCIRIRATAFGFRSPASGSTSHFFVVPALLVLLPSRIIPKLKPELSTNSDL